jgi:hypothetical protein
MARLRDNSPSTVLREAQRSSRRLLAQLTFPASGAKLNMGMVFKFVAFETNFGSGGLSVQSKNLTDAHIALPLPENIQDSLNIGYDTVDLGAVAAGIKTGEAVSGAFAAGGVGAAIDSFAGRFAGDATFLARTLANISGPVGGALSLAAGNVPNPFQTAVFKQVQLRKHNLNFRLVPETPEDSLAIQNIVNMFKFNSLPGNAGNFLSMPKQVQVEYFGTNALYGFGRCVIEGVTVNYAPSNAPAFFKNGDGSLVGAPQAVELQLQLSEIEALDRGAFASEDKDGNVLGVAAGNATTVDIIPQNERQGNPLTRGNVRNPVAQYKGST